MLGHRTAKAPPLPPPLTASLPHAAARQPDMDGLDVKSYVAGVLSPLLVLAGVKMGRSLVAPSIKADREPHPQGLKARFCFCFVRSGASAVSGQRSPPVTDASTCVPPPAIELPSLPPPPPCTHTGRHHRQHAGPGLPPGAPVPQPGGRRRHQLALGGRRGGGGSEAARGGCQPVPLLYHHSRLLHA